MLTAVQFAVLAAIATIGYGGLLRRWVLRLPTGSSQMQGAAAAIQAGAKAYLQRQYQTVGIVAAAFFLVLGLVWNWPTALAFLIGAVLSAVASFIGMNVSVRANVRTTAAAQQGLPTAFKVASRGAGVTGMLVVGLALLGVAGFYWASGGNANALIGLGFGGSLFSLFARLGGGVYSKAAGIGADLVGEVKAVVSNDDLHNPAVIADSVGDNVGDCAGMAADLFETYAVTAIVAVLIGSSVFRAFSAAVTYPLVLGGVAVLASILASLTVKLEAGQRIMTAHYRGLLLAAALAAVGFYFVTKVIMVGNGFYSTMNIFLTTLVGLAATGLLAFITEYFTSTSFQPVRSIAEASAAGQDTGVIRGLAVSMKSTVGPVAVIAAATLASYSLAGLYGVAIAAMSMLSLAGTMVAINSFGPIADNAGGIAAMAALPDSVRAVTNSLDAAGHTAKAMIKGYAIGSAGLTALVLFAAYVQEFTDRGITLRFALNDHLVLIGLFLGGLLTYLFSARCLEAVGKVAGLVVIEVRRQLRDPQGSAEEVTARPDYRTAVDTVTKGALKEMIVPALIPLAAPILVGLVLGPEALGGLLVGSIVIGLFLSISMTTGGAAWDNAQKYAASDKVSGQDPLNGRSSVTPSGTDGVYKDTVGPAVASLIKAFGVVSLLAVYFLA